MDDSRRELEQESVEANAEAQGSSTQAEERRARRRECTRPDESFDGQGSRYADDLSSWPGNEPAIGFTSTALLAFSPAARP